MPQNSKIIKNRTDNAPDGVDTEIKKTEEERKKEAAKPIYLVRC